MSGGHCTHPTGGPAIRLKHKKTLRSAAQVIHKSPRINMADGAIEQRECGFVEDVSPGIYPQSSSIH